MDTEIFIHRFSGGRALTSQNFIPFHAVWKIWDNRMFSPSPRIGAQPQNPDPPPILLMLKFLLQKPTLEQSFHNTIVIFL